MKIQFEIIENAQLEKTHREIFASMLKKQNKVQGDLTKKADRCKCICLASYNEKVVAIGAIKQKTSSDFTSQKAAVPELSSEFNWELGYIFTTSEHQGKGLASSITKTLLQFHGSENLMASTEITANPGMVKILEKNKFKLFGNPWKSAIHGNDLGLFLRFK